MPTIAIIGSGPSGLAAAHTFLDAGYTVTLFEKSRVVGGRAATRIREGFTYDYGANYIKPGGPASIDLITKRFSSPELIDITKPVWTFDATGHIQEGDAAQNAEPKWSYRTGINTLFQLMAKGLDIHRNTRITHIEQQANGWTLFSETEQIPDTFTQLLITIPAKQSIDLIQASKFQENLRQTISADLEKSEYNALISVLCGYTPRPKTRPYYALVNTDRNHAISWLAWEHEKNPERAPAHAGLIMAQMATPYSQEHWQTPNEEIYHDVTTRIATLIDEPLPTPYFTDIQRWRYALPGQKADGDALNAITLPLGLAFCGDGFAGGRVNLAIEQGMKVAQQLIG